MKIPVKRSSEKVIIYGSGDKGSKALVDRLFQLGIEMDFRDIRSENIHGVRENLKFLIEHQLDTVPQVFMADLTWLGNYEAALDYIERIAAKNEAPSPAPMLA